MNRIIKIHYAYDETGPAEVLSKRLVRIIDPPLLTDEFFRDDIVHLDRDVDDYDGIPHIEHVVYKRHPERSFLAFNKSTEYHLLHSIFAILGCESLPLLPPGEDQQGMMIVGHQPHVDPVALAEAIGIKQPTDEDVADHSPPNELRAHPNASAA